MPGSLARTREALRSADFRRLFGARLTSTTGDGLFQAALITSIVFSPDKQSTVAGFAIASMIVVLPYTLLGPFAGVFIDRWSRRRILVVSPLLRAALAALVLTNPQRAPAIFYVGALAVLSINRFFLSTASAVVPRLVPAGDLLIANSLATIGGTTTLLLGVFAGGLVADAYGTTPIVLVAVLTWLVTSGVSTRVRSDLRPHPVDRAGALGSELVGVVRELVDGARHIAATPRALGPITSMGIDQLGQGLVLVLSLFVFRERFREGVGSFSWLIGAGGLGVLVGLVTVGALGSRLVKERLIGLAFALGGVVLLLVAAYVTGASVLVASFAVGLTFAWKKIPSDTMIQEAVPDGLRGRTFAVYDVVYQGLRLGAAGLAVALLPAIGESWTVALVGVVFLLWSPVLPRWVRRAPALRLQLVDGRPAAVVWGTVEESVRVVREWRTTDEHPARECLRLELGDGSELDVSRAHGGDRWRVDRELED